MDTRRALRSLDDACAFGVGFSPTGQYFAVAVQDGFKVFKTPTCEIHLDQTLDEPYRSATMLGHSQVIGLTALAKASAPQSRRLVLWDADKREQSACIQTKTPIVKSALSEKHIVIVQEHTVNLYRHESEIEKVASYETCSNPQGLCALGEKVLALPGRTPGHVQVIELETLNVEITPAHTSTLQAMCLSTNEDFVVTASHTGTLIRVLAIPSGSKILELRRGVSPALIYALAVSPSDSYLAVTSDTGTLHVFSLPRRWTDHEPITEGGWQDVEHSPAASEFSNTQKWSKYGIAKMPFAPRVFTDVYSFASATFTIGHTDLDPVKCPKGVVGWTDDNTIVVVSGGRDARYERFEISYADQTKATCQRVGWSRFLRP